MYRYNIISLLSIIGLLIGSASCEDYLEQYPRDSVAEEEAFENIDGIESSLGNLYDRMEEGLYNHRQMNLVGGLLADQLDVAESNSGRLHLHPVNFEGEGFNLWSRLYNDINRVNTILHYIEDIEADEERINQAKGEAYAHRAWRYFDLLRIYARPYMYQEPLVQGEPQGVIYKTEHFVGIDDKTFQPRGTIEEGYQFVLDDLQNALDHLSDENEFPYRFTPVVIEATLARVHLYMGNWQEAASYAETVIESGVAELVENYEDAFIPQPGEESIFEMAFARGYTPNRYAATSGMAWQDPETGEGYGDIILRRELTDLLEEYREKGDQRAEMFFYCNKDGEDVAYQSKYTGRHGSYYQDDNKMIRIAEMYLIAAEAYAEIGNFEQARYYLNELRNARGSGDIDIEDNKDEFIDLIFTERRVEFYSEMSHRWFDLRRRGKDIPKGCPDRDAGTPLDFEDHRVVDRIPDGEIEQNENCVQNPGY